MLPLTICVVKNSQNRFPACAGPVKTAGTGWVEAIGTRKSSVAAMPMDSGPGIEDRQAETLEVTYFVRNHR